MAIDISLELDGGPITWVKDEIDTSLMRALDSIKTLKEGYTAEAAEAVRNELHRVSGALELVGIDGLAAIAVEFERHFSPELQPISKDALEKVEKGARRLVSHLNEIAAGATAVPLRFIDEYAALGRIRGVGYGSADLFFPDISRRPPKLEGVTPPEPSRMAPFLMRHRRDYQQGLLMWLRGQESGLTTMRNAISQVESAYPLPSQRSFWWTAHALLEAVEHRLIEISPGLKQLLARVDLQLRRLVEGSTKVADRLRREVLYQVARADEGSERVDAVKALYELGQLVPRKAPKELDLVELRPILESIKEARIRCEDAWTGLSSGRGNALPLLQDAVASLSSACKATKIGEFIDLSTALSSAANHLTAGQVVTESVSSEFASCLFLLQTAVDQISALPMSFRAQVNHAIDRLNLASKGEQIPDSVTNQEIPNSLTQIAQERETTGQVAREIKANLRQIEQALDTLFRDRTAKDELKPVPAWLTQTVGAMTMLGWTQAAALLDEAGTTLIDAFSSEEEIPANKVESFADVLAGLSFYVDLRERDDKNAETMLENLKLRAAGQTALASGLPHEESSIELSLTEHKKILRNRLTATATQSLTTAELRSVYESLTSIQQDAELLEDKPLLDLAGHALELVNQGKEASSEFMQLLKEISGDTTLDVPPVSSETTKLLDTAPAVRDEALLDIFIEEAQEVVQNISPLADVLKSDPSNRMALLDIRRAFHTFKGSGRMVGLLELGDVAWKVEKNLNSVIEAEEAVSSAQLSLIEKAIEVFSAWVVELQTSRQVVINESILDPWLKKTVTSSVDSFENPESTDDSVDALPVNDAAHDTALPDLAAALPVIETLEMPEATWAALTAANAQENALSTNLSEELGGAIKNVINFSGDESKVERDFGDTKIWGVEISAPLFSILTEEAATHLQTIEHELIALQFDPQQLPSDDLVRASHTLCGIHRTAGFNNIGELAGSLEHVLLEIQKHGRDNVGLELLRAAHRSLSLASLRLRDRTPLTADESNELNSVQLQLNEAIKRFEREASPVETIELEGRKQIESILPDEVPGERNATSDDLPPISAVIEEGQTAELLNSALSDLSVDTYPNVEPPDTTTENVKGATEPVDGSTLKPSAIQVEEVTRREVEPQVTSERVTPTQLESLAANLLPSIVPLDSSTAEMGAADILADVRDDVDGQVLSIFLEEAQELFPMANRQLREWREDVRATSYIDGLRRTLHTLKGSARMAGAMRLGEIAHQLETHILEASGTRDTAFFDRSQEYLDDIGYLLDALTRGESNTVLPRFAAANSKAAITIDTALEDTNEADTLLSTDTKSDTTESSAKVLVLPRIAAEVVLPSQHNVVQAEADNAGSMLRVRSDAVELLSDEAGEIAINRSRIESEVRNIKSGMLDLTSAVVRLRTQLREIEIQGESQIQSKLDQESTEFDPLEFDRFTRFQELTRGLAEAVNDVATVQQSLSKSLSDAETALAVQTRLSRSVQLRLQALRTVPFSSVSDRLYRVLRQTAKELDKRANLDIQGGKAEIDRGVLERLSPVLEHLIRNSLAHGIETTPARVQLGKAPIGELTLAIRQQTNEVIISLKDDGGGVPLDKVRQRAEERGILQPGETATDAQLLDLIFHPGFTTSDIVTAVAGRGVGMDVVRSEIKALGGRVDVSTDVGQGTTFILTVPLSLAVTQVTLVNVNDSVFGVPSTLVDRVRQITLEERETAVNAGAIWNENRAIPYRALNELLQLPLDKGELSGGIVSVMILRSGDSTVALEIPQVIGNQEVVAKPYGPQLARVPGLTGLTVLADGTIALLLNPINLLHASSQDERDNVRKRADAVGAASDGVSSEGASTAATASSLLALPPDTLFAGYDNVESVLSEATTEPAKNNVIPLRRKPTIAPTVLVVDDSLTVRKITSRLLEREGYIAATAKDGIDALQVLSEIQPAVILLDIEMPRMDGFEFTKAIKADEKQRDIPIIMITSRTAEKHRNVAMELGVNEYLGKPYQDEQLLQLIKAYVDAQL